MVISFEEKDRAEIEESILKPCPFCGGEAENEGIKDFSGKTILASVVCKECGASTKSYASVNGANEAWNTRI